MCLIKDFFAIYFGPILIKKWTDGEKMIEVFRLHLALKSSRNFFTNTISIWFVERIKFVFVQFETKMKLRFFLQVVEDGYEFFAKRQLVTLFSAPNYCGEFDNAGAMMSVDETLMCSFQVDLRCSFFFFVNRIFDLDFETVREKSENTNDDQQSSSHSASCWSE